MNQRYYRKRGNETETEHKTRKRGGLIGKLLRAGCLVLVCAILSGAAAYGAMEYRFNKGDFTIVNQVVLGGSPDNQNSGGLSASVHTPGVRMSAEDIYTMACTQVVSISTRSEAASGAFGGLIPGASIAEAGSGFIISSDGYILTNYHVVESAYLHNLPIMVSLNDGT